MGRLDLDVDLDPDLDLDRRRARRRRGAAAPGRRRRQRCRARPRSRRRAYAPEEEEAAPSRQAVRLATCPPLHLRARGGGGGSAVVHARTPPLGTSRVAHRRGTCAPSGNSRAAGVLTRRRGSSAAARSAPRRPRTARPCTTAIAPPSPTPRGLRVLLRAGEGRRRGRRGEGGASGEGEWEGGAARGGRRGWWVRRSGLEGEWEGEGENWVRNPKSLNI